MPQKNAATGTGTGTSPPLPYRGSAPDDALRLVGAGPQLSVAEGGGAGGEGGVLEEPPLLQALLPQRPEVLPQVGDGVAVPPRARRCRPLLRHRRRHPRHRPAAAAPPRPGPARPGLTLPPFPPPSLPAGVTSAASAQPRADPHPLRVTGEDSIPHPWSPPLSPVDPKGSASSSLLGTS